MFFHDLFVHFLLCFNLLLISLCCCSDAKLRPHRQTAIYRHTWVYNTVYVYFIWYARFISMIHWKTERSRVKSSYWRHIFNALIRGLISLYDFFFKYAIFFNFFLIICIFFKIFCTLQTTVGVSTLSQTVWPSTTAKWQRRLSLSVKGLYYADILGLFWPCCNVVPSWKTYLGLCFVYAFLRIPD